MSWAILFVEASIANSQILNSVLFFFPTSQCWFGKLFCHADDDAVSWENCRGHDTWLHAVLKRISASRLTLNDKFWFAVEEVISLDMMFSVWWTEASMGEELSQYMKMMLKFKVPMCLQILKVSETRRLILVSKSPLAHEAKFTAGKILSVSLSPL